MTSVFPQVVVARPRASLLRNTLSSVLLFSVPLYGALYILGINRGSWLVVFGTQLAGVAFCAVVWLRYRVIAVRVTATSIEEQGLFFRQRSALEDVRRVTIARVYRSSSAETWTQLLVTDAQGKRLLRMRGVFWAETEIRRIAAAIGVPPTELAEPLTRKAFAISHPGSVDWYENNRWFAGLVLAAFLAVAIGVVVGLMALAGVHIESVV
jgi:hypothetical protein